MSIYTHTYQVKETEVPIIISDEKNKSEISSKKNLKNRLTTGTVALLIALLAVVSATYAWYVYNTGRHTTKVRMAAGAGVNLQISNSYSGTYGSAAVLDSFTGRLNPVSTNRISGGFQKVIGFTNGTENQSNLVASLFGRGDYTDYYKTSLFLRTNGNPTDIYIADIGFEDSDSKNPISSAIRAGFVVHRIGRSQPADAEYIFAISDKKNPKAEYNTAKGKEGDVLDCTNNLGSQTLKNLSVSFAGVVKQGGEVLDTEVNQLKRSLGRAFLWLFLLLIVATGTTFAWFNLTGMRHTNVTPMAGTVSKGGSTLLISTSESGPFDKTCELVLTGNP